MPTVSVLIHTKNAAETLASAIKSAKWADEIVVFDTLSQDTTVELAKSLGCRVFQHGKDPGFVEPVRNLGIEACDSEWVFILDADETIPGPLAKEIPSLVSKTVDAYYVPRQNWIFGHAMQHTGWWPDYQLRLFRKGSVTWPKIIHGQPTISGTVETVPAKDDLAIQHQNYPDISAYVQRLDRYTTIEAQQLQKTAEPPQPNSSQLLRAYFHEFLRRFFVDQGYQDGEVGTALSLLQPTYSVLALLKSWIPATARTDDSRKPTKAELRELLATTNDLTREFMFWRADLQIRHTKGLTQWWWRVRRKLGI
jgi:(heptosyl)LPS beta-1,4-glucosyltransferase